MQDDKFNAIVDSQNAVTLNVTKPTSEIIVENTKIKVFRL